MLANYLKISRRNLIRQKSYTLVNVIGLALGMGCGILIFSLVSYHLSFDRYHSKADRTYRIVTELHQETVGKTGSVPTPVGKAFRQDYTFADKVARVVTFGEQLISLPLSRDNKRFEEKEGVAYAEPAFFEILDFTLATGDQRTLLAEPNTAVLTKRIADKYFGEENPIGQTIRIDNRIDFKITGVLKDLPAATDRRQEIYLSYASLKQQDEYLAGDQSWGLINSGSNCFVLLKNNVSPASVDKAFPGLVRKYYDGKEAKMFRFHLQPLSDVHFNAEFGGEVSRGQLMALSFIGIFLLMTACVNFINLATAQALRRAKEIGVRKALGSLRSQLFWQFICETALITLLALLLALVITQLALPFVNQLLATRLTINFLRDYQMVAFLVALLGAVIFLAGAYPGLVLARFEPIRALRGKLSQQQVSGFSVRRGLVIAQFAICQILLISTIVITNQMRYSQQTDMGFSKEAIVMLPIPKPEPATLSTLSSRLLQVPGVEKVSFCHDAPASRHNWNTRVRYDSRAEDEVFEINFKFGDAQFLATFDLPLLAGRNLTPSDTIREFLINEMTVKKLQAKSNEDVLGKKLFVNGRQGTIAGVVKDFHNRSFHSLIEPLCITSEIYNYGNCAVKINMKDLSSTLPAMQQIWSDAYPEDVYKYEFLDERLAKFYELDQLILRLVQFFAGIAILIGCLGLYGMVSFMAAQKTKEIGVRKVLGASTAQIMWLFGKEFARLIGIAFLIAAPLSWWTMKQYLQDYQYRITLGPEVFLLAIALTCIIAIITVGYQSVKAALANPVRSLRSE